MATVADEPESEASRRKPIVGLAGGIGSGKSTVARMLAEFGGVVISSDILNRDALNSEEVATTLQAWWGPSVIGSDGRPDRRRLSDLVFTDPTRRQRLERLLHPRIAAERRRRIELIGADPSARFVVLDSPLLFEAGVDAECDCVVFVEAPAELRRARVAAARGWSVEEFDRREAVQDALGTKRSRADYVCRNDGDEATLRRRLAPIVAQVMNTTPRDHTIRPVVSTGDE
ncbi:MAG: dephospho-CoA kinase [Phycisphaerae bacterium]